MSPHAYTEDQLVEQPAISLFTALDWQMVSALDETFGPGGTLGRETKGEGVLVARPRQPGLPRQAERRHRGLRQRVRLAGAGAGPLRRGHGRREPRQGQG